MLITNVNVQKFGLFRKKGMSTMSFVQVGIKLSPGGMMIIFLDGPLVAVQIRHVLISWQAESLILLGEKKGNPHMYIILTKCVANPNKTFRKLWS